MLVFIKMEIALRFLIFLSEHAVSRGELGHDETAATKISNEATKNRVSDSRHGGEDCGGSNFDAADGKACGNWPPGWRLADKACPEPVEGNVRPTRDRIVPHFAPGSILLRVP